MRDERPFKPSVLDKLIGPLARIRGDGTRDVLPCYVAPLDPFTERELRNVVMRDVAWVLNDVHFAAAVPLDDFPEIRMSVLNQGVGDLTSMGLTGANIAKRARDIAAAVQAFEPRLLPGSVRVVADSGHVDNENKVRFTISGELKGAIDDRYVELKTAIALDSGDIEVAAA